MPPTRLSNRGDDPAPAISAHRDEARDREYPDAPLPQAGLRHRIVSVIFSMAAATGACQRRSFRINTIHASAESPAQNSITPVHPPHTHTSVLTAEPAAPPRNIDEV